MGADGNTASIVLDCHAAVRVNGNIDPVANTGERLVNGIIDNFLNKVMQGLNVRAAYIHAGAFTYMFDAFQSLNGTYIIVDLILFFSHKNLQQFF
jgi:hypothetical protein